MTFEIRGISVVSESFANTPVFVGNRTFLDTLEGRPNFRIPPHLWRGIKSLLTDWPLP